MTPMLHHRVVTTRRLVPAAHLLLIVGVLRKLEIVQIIETMVRLNSAYVVSSDCGVEILVLVILDGDHAFYKAGRHLDEYSMLPQELCPAV